MRDRPGGRARREGGFSLLEVMIAAFLLIGIMVMAATFLNSGNRLLGVVSVGTEAETKADLLADQIAKWLRNAHPQSIRTAAGVILADGQTSNDGIQARLITNFSGRAIMGETINFSLGNGESNVGDGLDNDRDNLVDERTLRFRRWDAASHTPVVPLNDATAPLCTPTGGTVQDVITTSNLQGIAITRSAKRLSIAVTVLRYDMNLRQLRRFIGRAEVALKN